MNKNLKKLFAGLMALLICVTSANVSALASDTEKQPNVFNKNNVSAEVKAGEEGYTFVSKYGPAYEMSNHMVSANGGANNSIPQTLLLLDASKDYTWTPDGPYEYGKSNYEVLYCCDEDTGYEGGVYYRRVNLEDSTYYSDSAARHIRAIVTNAYPYVSVEEMKANLKAQGFVGADKLTRAEIIAAVQTAIWSYSNTAPNLFYSQTFDVPSNTQWGTVLHDYTNEMDVWWKTGKRVFSKDDEVAARINGLVQHLKKLEPVAVSEGGVLITDIEVLRSEPVADSEDLYNVTLKVILNSSSDGNDDIKLNVTSGTDKVSRNVTGEKTYEITVQAKSGDEISAVVEGTQVVPRGVYLYEPKGGRDVSQTLVGVAQGATDVYAKKTFQFVDDMDLGIRIYKQSSTTGKPISEITFNAYKVEPAEGDTLSAVPTQEEIAKYKTADNKVASATTDEFGYAALEVPEKGTYLIVEEHNTDKVVAPVNPFYVQLPSMDSENDADVDIVAVYPKNEPITPPEDPDITIQGGRFKILKHRAGDENHLLAGAEFQLFRPATDLDPAESVTVLECNEAEYSVVPVTIDGENVIMTTGEDGTATSPELAFGSYFILETKAPEGYQKGFEAIPVTVVDSNNEAVVKVANNILTVLPETGGIGTTVFSVTGGIIMLLAAALLLGRRKEEA